MADYRRDSHTVSDIKYHLAWVTKYRYHILKGAVGKRLRDLILQGCQARGWTIIKGVVAKDHVHLLISCPPSISPAKIAQYLKGRSSRLLQEEFPRLKKRYWGQHLWARGYFCESCGTVTDELIRQYIEIHTDENETTFTVHDESFTRNLELAESRYLSGGFSLKPRTFSPKRFEPTHFSGWLLRVSSPKGK